MIDRYRDATDLCRSLECQLKQQAAEAGTELIRQRHLVVFDRAAVRLIADPAARWVLKGGAVLEFRLCSRARATKDMNLAAYGDASRGLDGRTVCVLLIEVLAVDAGRDRFDFQVSASIELQADMAGRRGWRCSAHARLASKTFSTVCVDVVVRSEQIAVIERLPLPNLLTFAGTPARDIEAVDHRQRFVRRLNTRIKYLVDLVLLIKDGVEADQALADVVRHVFAGRATPTAHLTSSPTRRPNGPLSTHASRRSDPRPVTTRCRTRPGPRLLDQGLCHRRAEPNQED